MSIKKTFNKVLIANRGAIAARILRTLKALGVGSVVVYADADRDAPYVHQADEAYSLGEGGASDTYLDIDKLIAIAKQSGAQAVHPGYGFLSENTRFITACDTAGLIFLGPTAEQIEQFGLKHQARALAEKAGVPLVPGSKLLDSIDEALKSAEQIGYPVMLKSTAGGGGIGMQVCQNTAELERAFDSVKGLGQRNFGDDGVFLEAYIARARHIEVQLFGDGQGKVVALGERDCSTQRRHQKVLEECPAPNLPEHVRQALHETAVQLGKAVNYRSAGTVEFIYDTQREAFYFLEVNTRLQVEHGVTEMVYGVDIVEWMVKLGAGELPSLESRTKDLAPSGHAVQARLYAEDPAHDFRPSAGLLTEVDFPQADGLRIDHAIEAGLEISALFDPMLAKVIVHADSRDNAIEQLADTLDHASVYGITTNRTWLAHVLRAERFLQADLDTHWLTTLEWAPPVIEVLAPGTMTTIQDFPGRQGHWDVGVPPSGPFDDWSFRLGNRLLDNPADAAGLEITLTGPTLCFHRATQIVLAGADLPATLDGKAVSFWQVIDIPAGATLTLGKAAVGARAYLLVRGGIQCPRYLGSRSTFTLGQFGGHGGRALRSGDMLDLPVLAAVPATQLDQALIPTFGNQDGGKTWQVAVLYGPHGAPDFFTGDDIERFFDHEWEVHYNSSRTGVRLIGPRPEWARADGGEAGLHPSNIHDNAYAFGTIDFTGDMPVILGPDGPSLGGFVCPATVVRAERWKLGQLAAGDKVRFVPVSLATARAVEERQLKQLASLTVVPVEEIQPERDTPIVRDVPTEQAGERIVYRRAGDDFLLIEFGAMELDIALRFRVHAWMLWLQQHSLPGLRELTPGIRSLQIHYEPLELPLDELLAHLQNAEQALVDVESLEVESRVVHLPLSWDDPACQEAIDKYQRSVRPDAPWCPSNLDFIRRINALESEQQVRDIVFDASYLVMGLGDVYLGAPVATPLDPRQRLVTTKYNPARTWTAENSVGIGGAYLCVYGMEGPGGYQFVGRTLQMWNRYRTTAHFENPWLLRFFDQLRFHDVSHDELEQIRRDFPHGRYDLAIETARFRLADYQAEIDKNAEAIEAFRSKREAAFQAEMAAWRANGQFTFEDQAPESVEVAALNDDELGIESPVTGSLWKLLVKEGEQVTAGQPVALVESMKMEVEITAHCAGHVVRLPIAEGASIAAGQPLVVLSSE
ncbi:MULTISPECIES: urea carboxylase [unclassified Halomonas]|uniref:urea carboxylase n=1 Tax=unclassified Halomonas TaxID=2609666 RepID=UPI0007D97A81|nr:MULTISPECIES: urea carboxylase [unclassified Halomonas]MBT2787423.1 urea carboxylase [Halomonas sp. ISL-106]MBT2796215.1 urea carboxylase [Halomonas sp. ISL-104]OAL57630.1 urea carboxylase [Halomonas sp. ALS9]